MKELIFADPAKTDLKRLDRPTRLRVIAAIQRLAVTNTGNIKKLQGTDPPEYRLRIGDWRIRFSYPDGNTIRINRVQNRKTSTADPPPAHPFPDRKQERMVRAACFSRI